MIKDGVELGDTSFPYGWNLPSNGVVTDVVAAPPIILPLSIYVSPAESLRVRIYNELEGTTAACFKSEQSWTRLGILLAEFKAKEHWREYEQYVTFDDFISELK